MDPYKILGVSPDVSDEELKKAYRTLAKKYHPDRYAGNPLEKTASEKMKQINEAYDMILEQRKNSTQRYPDTAYDRQPLWTEVRQLIAENRLEEAEELLYHILSSERDGEWYYLMGVLSYGRGFLEEAYNYSETACHLAPDNMEYRAFYDRVREYRQGKFHGGYEPQRTVMPCCDCCDICTCLACSDCLCDCLGGC